MQAKRLHPLPTAPGPATIDPGSDAQGGGATPGVSAAVELVRLANEQAYRRPGWTGCSSR
jgi:hypothetical protein